MKLTNWAVIITAAGSGTRMSISPDFPKQYATIDGKPILQHAIEKFVHNDKIDIVMVTIRKEDEDIYLKLSKTINSPKLQYVIGSNTRQASVFNALKALEEQNPKYVLIHDAVRPYTSQELITRIMQTLEENERCGIVPTLPVRDTLKVVRDGKVISSLNRLEIHTTQTPQAFHYKTIFICHKVANFNILTDDSSVAAACNVPIHTVMGEKQNIKITDIEDMPTINTKEKA